MTKLGGAWGNALKAMRDRVVNTAPKLVVLVALLWKFVPRGISRRADHARHGLWLKLQGWHTRLPLQVEYDDLKRINDIIRDHDDCDVVAAIRAEFAFEPFFEEFFELGACAD